MFTYSRLPVTHFKILTLYAVDASASHLFAGGYVGLREPAIFLD